MSSFLDTMKRKKNFYRNVYRGTLTTLVITLILIVLLLIVNLFYYFNRGDTAYYATSLDGQIFPLQAQEVPPPNADFSNIVEY